MTWFRQITQIEYLYITLFLVLYISYAVQMYLISKKINLNLGRLILKFTLRSIYLSLLIIAFLGPSFGDIKKEIKAIGKDIYVAIDLSTSMNANDISPSRLEKVKFELGKELKNFNSDRIGLIAFSEEAFIQCPLTYDQAAVKLFLEGLSTNLLSNGSTNLNAPLGLAIQKFTSLEHNNPIDQAKVLILITDGEDFSNQELDPLISKIKEVDIRLIVLGVGSETGSKIPVGRSYKMDDQGKPAISMLNKKKLKRLAQLSGGRYYEITPDRNEIKSMVNKVVKMEGMLKGTRKVESGANKYFYFLFIALVLVIADVLVTVKTIKI